MTQNEQLDDDLETFMAIARAVAVEEAKTMATTPDMLRRADAIVESARDRLAAMRRDELAKRPSNVVRRGIRDWIRAMSLAEAFAELTRFKVEHPELQLAFRDFEQMSLDDAHSALEDVVSLTERGD